MTDLPRKPKNAQATRSDILEEARAAFTRAGYDAIGLREIAAAAGVSAAMINRYFGSKEALFAEAVPDAFSVAGLIGNPRADFGQRIVSHLAAKVESGDRFDPTVAMIRSAPSAEARELLRKGLEEKFVVPLANWLGGPNAHARSAIIVALLAGHAVLTDLLSLNSMESDASEETRQLLASLLQQLVDHEA